MPPNSRFDYEAYHKDIREGVPRSVIDRKMKKLEYYTTKPKPPKPPKDAIVDVEHYEYDVKRYGKKYAESMREMGIYRYRRHRDFW